MLMIQRAQERAVDNAFLKSIGVAPIEPDAIEEMHVESPLSAEPYDEAAVIEGLTRWNNLYQPTREE